MPPEKDGEVRGDDIILVRGSRDGIDKLCYMADSEPPDWTVRGNHENLRKHLSKMKDNSSSLVDMAFSSVLFDSKEVAEEVRELEEKFDELNYKAWLEVLEAAKREKEVKNLTSALQAVKSLEAITDASDSIADVVLRGMEVHPVFNQALGDTEEKIARVKIVNGSSTAGHDLKEIGLWRRMGIHVLAMRKGDQFIPYPKENQVVDGGDRMIVQGPVEMVNELIEVGQSEKKWSHLR